MKITDFRRGRGEGRRVGVFDAEVAPGIIVNDLTLIRKPNGELRVYGKGVFLRREAAQELALLALAHSARGAA